MKKRIFLFLTFYLLISFSFSFTHIMPSSAWTNGPAIINTSASSEDNGYESYMAFDNNNATMWHSRWNDIGGGTAYYDFPQSLIVEFDGIYWIDCIGYLTRQNAFNGTVYEYEVWVSTTGSVNDIDTDSGWTQVAAGEWNQNFWDNWVAASNDGWGSFVNVEFDAVEANLIKFKVIDGVGGWASVTALEFGFLGIDYIPMAGFEPKSAPGTPAPIVELVEPELAERAGIEIETTPVPIPAAPIPQTGDIMMIIFAAISMVCVFTYKKIAARKI